MRRCLGLVAAAVVVGPLLLCVAAEAEEFVFQQGVDGYTEGKDVTISGDGWPVVPQSRLRMKYKDGQEVYNSLIWFDGIGSALQGLSVVEAKVTLTFQRENVLWAPATMDVHGCRKDWTDPNWYVADPCTAWEVPGAQDPCSDRDPLESSTYMGDRYWYSISNRKNYDDGQEFNFALTPELVQSWVDDPCSNRGLILIMNHDAATDVTFSSNGDADPCAGPLLWISAVAPVQVPDVTALPIEDANVALTAAGLEAGLIGRDCHATLPAGHVIDQDPGAGAWVLPGTAVDLIESVGPHRSADLDGSYYVALGDFARLAGEWLSCEQVTSDLTCDGCVDLLDLIVMAEAWLSYQGP